MKTSKNKDVILSVFEEVLGSSSVDEQTIEKYFDPSYIQNVDGVVLDYQGFIKHMKKQKEVIKSIDVEFVTIVQEGDIVFTNHIVDAQKKDDFCVKVKVIAQFTIRDGRLIGCDELTHLLSGNKEDKDIGSRH